MKYVFLILLLPTLLFAQAQDWDYPLFELENAPPPTYPFSVSGQALAVEKASFLTPGFEDKKMLYREATVAFAYTHPFCEIWGLIFGAGWVGTEVKMQDNPDFHDTYFNYVNFSIGGFTTAFPKWTWTLTAAAFLDTEEFSFVDYALYQGVLWGRYNFCKWVELDVGMILEVGLNKTKIWPIVGFVYTPWDKWKLSAIYPINISLEYECSRYWKLAGSIRFLRNRHRVEQDEPLSQGIFEYRDTGAELDLFFTPFKWGFVKGFAGTTFDGDFKVTNRNNHEAIHYKFKGSFYGGFSALISY